MPLKKAESRESIIWLDLIVKITREISSKTNRIRIYRILFVEIQLKSCLKLIIEGRRLANTWNNRCELFSRQYFYSDNF
jgi:hypothetical protein